MSVRVVRGTGTPTDGASSRATTPDPLFVATARRLLAEREAARSDGARVEAAARDEAARILARAEEDARRVQEDARRAGAEAGRLEALAVVAAAHAEEAKLVERSLDLIVSAARVIAERAVSEALVTDDATLLAWTKTALVPLRGSRRIALRAAAPSIERLRAHLAVVAEQAAVHLELIVDDALPAGVVVARSELGETRIELTAQVAALAEVLRGALEPEVRKRRG